MTPRLHGRCPVCSRVESLRPDGTLTQHRAPAARHEFRGRWCPGAGAQPAEGSVDAWRESAEGIVAHVAAGGAR